MRRVRRCGYRTPDAEEELTEAGIRIAPGALLTGARRLLSGDLAHSIPFRDHHVAVQDEASQLVAALVGKGERILDCCAAPGGKTAAMAARNPGAEDHRGGIARTSRKGAERAGCSDEREGRDRQRGGD